MSFVLVATQVFKLGQKATARSLYMYHNHLFSWKKYSMEAYVYSTCFCSQRGIF